MSYHEAHFCQINAQKKTKKNIFSNLKKKKKTRKKLA